MKLLRLACLVFILAASASAIDREAFTFTKYDLQVRVEPQQQRLAVRGSIVLRNDSKLSLKNLSLQLSSTLDWRSIRMEGKPLQFVSQPYTSDVDHTGVLSEAIVSLPREIAPKSMVTIEVGYEGLVTLNATRLTRIGMPEGSAKHSDWDQISDSFTAVRGFGHVVWYPVASETANLSEGENVFEAVGRWRKRTSQSQFNLQLRVTRNSGNAATIVRGGAIAPQPADNSAEEIKTECTSIGMMTEPIFAVANFSQVNSSAADVFYLQDHQSAAESYSHAVDAAIPLIKEWFGTRREKVSVAELVDGEAAPFEAGSLLLAPLSHSEFKLFELTAAHQLTHASFISPQLWIYEGLAHFAQALDREKNDGRSAAIDFMGIHRTAIVEIEKALTESSKANSSGNSLVETYVEELYRSKAMYVWWMLRDMVGEAALKKALAKYDPKEDIATGYIEKLIQSESNREVKWFFDDWVYHDRGLPDFRVNSVFTGQPAHGTSIVTITVENTGDAGAEVPVIIRTGEGELLQKLEVRAKSKASMRVPATSAVSEVVVNDGSVPESDTGNNTYKIEQPAR